MSDADAVATLRLIRTPSIGPITFRGLIARFGTASRALAAAPDLARKGGRTSFRLADAALARRELDAVAALGGRHLMLGTPAYPALLAELEDAPPALIVQGRTDLLQGPAVAMVGARNASAAGMRLARQLAHELSERGQVIVSGLARGIDTAAHVGAIEGGTIAVIAGGSDNHYPPENEALQRRIAIEGLVATEQPPGVEPRARHFPNRNRIIAGLAAATVVVEAAPRSGSLISARLAAEAGREVMAVPGSPLDPRAQGCNQLIRDGATLVQSADDILASLAPFGRPTVAARRDAFTPAPCHDASEAERRRIVSLLGPSPVTLDELIRQADAAPAVVQLVLLELELAGRVERHAGGRVSLVL